MCVRIAHCPLLIHRCVEVMGKRTQQNAPSGLQAANSRKISLCTNKSLAVSLSVLFHTYIFVGKLTVFELVAYQVLPSSASRNTHLAICLTSTYSVETFCLNLIVLIKIIL